MKRTIKIIAWIIGVILLLLLAIPYLFKGEILSIANQELNKNTKAKVEFADLNLSMFRSFPDLQVSLEELTVTGKEPFKIDTLVTFQTFKADVNLLSLLGDQIKIKAIELHRPEINAIVLENEQANWDIIPKDTTQPDKAPSEKDTTQESDQLSPVNVALHKFEIKQARIRYRDKSSNMKSSLHNLNYQLKGDMTGDQTNLEMQSSIDRVNVSYQGIKYVNEAAFNLDATIAADFSENLFVFKDNTLSLNNLSLSFDGSVQSKKNEIITDIQFQTNKSSFKTLLSLVPAVYKRDFQEVKTSGKLGLNGYIKGVYGAEQHPSARLNLSVEDAMFNYPDMPKKIENILVDLKVLYDGVDTDQSEVHVNHFHFDLAKNPFDMNAHITHPVSDPRLQAEMNGKINFRHVQDLVPMEDTKLQGILTSDIAMEGRSSMIEKEQYEEFKAKGDLSLQDFVYEGQSLAQPFNIQKAELHFTPEYIELARFQSTIGNSDMRMNGKIEQFIPYALADGTLKGMFKFQSDQLLLNQMLSSSSSTTESQTQQEGTQQADTAKMRVIEVPKNLNFTLTTNINYLTYKDFIIKNISGLVKVKQQKVHMTNLNMDMLGGRMLMNGAYSTVDTNQPAVDFGLDMTEVDIQAAAQHFAIMNKYAPIAQHCNGQFSSDFSFTADLDQHMRPVMNTVNGEGSVSSKQVRIEQSQTFGKMAEKLKYDQLKNMKLKDVNIHFRIKDGRIHFKPFDIHPANTDMTIQGSQGLDQTMDYTVDVSMPRSVLGGKANQLINNLTSKAASKGVDLDPGSKINLGVLVKGTFDDPKLQLNFKGTEDQKSIQQQVKEQAIDKGKEVIKEKKKEAQEQARKKAQNIIKKAKKKAKKIKQEARKAADKTREEADKQAQKVINEANNPVAKMAAKKTAKEIRKKADQKADELIREADKKAERIIKKAKKKADKID